MAHPIESRTTMARNAFYLVIGQVTTTALAIMISGSLGRTLGAHDFGLYYLITTMALFAYVFVEWGQTFFVMREAAREPGRSGDLLGSALALRMAFAVVVALPAGLIAWALGYGARTTSLSVLLILATLPFSLSQGFGMIFRARDEMARDATVSISNKAITLCVLLPALALGAGIPGMVLAQAVAGTVSLAVAGTLYRRLGAPPLRVSWATMREVLAAGTPLLATTAAISVQPYLDAIILSKLAPSAVVGWYGAARSVFGTLMAPAGILGAAAYPRLARASGDADVFREEVRSAFRPLLWLGALAATGTCLFASTAIGLLYGASGFAPAATILQVFAPGLLLLFIDILLGHVIYAAGRGTGFAIAKIISVLVGTGLDLVLIPLFQARFANGAIGVVVAFALSELVVFAGAIVVLRHSLESAMALDFARAVAAGGTTYLLFRLLMPGAPWLAIPLCVVAFTAASLAFGLMGLRDLALLPSLFRRRGSTHGSTTNSPVAVEADQQAAPATFG